MRKGVLAIGLFCTLSLFAQERSMQTFEKNWRFTREDQSIFAQADYDDSSWQKVTIPHDWAIYGPFSAKNDMQRVAIVQDGQKEAMEHAGRTGGLPFVGVGWYRLAFEAPAFQKGKKATFIFDGAMSHAKIFINGKEAGAWPYGYNSFYIDATPYLNVGKTNELAVRLENDTDCSRWYPGAGLYRNVHLEITDDVHVPTWGTYLMTPVVNEQQAKVVLKTSLEYSDASKDYQIETCILDPQGKQIAVEKSSLSAFDKHVFEQTFEVKQPKLWSPETPELYTAVSKIYADNQLKDTYSTRFGIRKLEIVPGKGAFLNGKPIKFQGVCNHHDLGPIGSAVNDAAIRRQIRIMKDMGANAIRTSHNMPAPELVQACDEMGMMLMLESFDEWKTPKVKNGYNKLFDEWVEKDLVNLIHHYRNNPSVVMWCIGNEVPDQSVDIKLAYRLQEICHREDPTRSVTQGMDRVSDVLDNGTAALMDIAALNYRANRIQEAYNRLPQQIILGSETASTVSSRGIYKFPVVRQHSKKYADHQLSSYDLDYCSWSELPEDNWLWYEDKPWAIGEFVWTGFDYLGEPTPYYTDWPSHSSLFGIVDLAGIPKDRFYLYRSHWNKKEETLHILPHWTWPGREGEVTPIFVYTNYPSAELFINGKSQGKRTKDLSVTVENSADSLSLAQLKRQQRYRLMWMDTRYEPGTVKVVAYDAQGKAVAEKEIHTAGKPHHIVLEADRSVLKADGKDLAFVTVKVVDKNGNLCPDAQMSISYQVKGAGTYRAGANGDATSLELFHQPRMKVFNGMMTAVVQTTEKAGRITLTAKGKGLQSGIIQLESK